MNPSKDECGHLTRLQAWCLYTIHFLFSWNVRSYEFSAIIFTASVYPDNLTAASIRGVSTTVAAILFSSFLGRCIDRSSSRLRTLSTTIWVHRSAIMIAYIFWLFLVDDAKAGHTQRNARDPPVQDVKNGTTIPPPLKTIDSHGPSISQNILFTIILLLGVLVRLSTIANNISIDREWLPALAPSSASSAPKTTPYDLTHLNAVVRRIDLICKVLTPLLVSTIVSTVNSYRICIMLGGLLTVLSWVAELWCARWMYRSSSALRAPKPLINKERKEGNLTVTPQSMPRHLWHTTRTLLLDQADALAQYFSTNVWIPATALALLHLTVLAYSSSLITYLLEIGFSLTLITTARACSSIVEVGSTVLTPWAVHYFSRKRMKHEKEVNGESDDAEAEGFLQRREETQAQGPQIDSTVLERVGLVGISWQLVNLIPVVIALFHFSRPASSSATPNPIPIPTSVVLLLFLSLSRAGLWCYDLTTQELTQTLVPKAHLSSFAGTQESFQSTFELSHWIATAVYGNARQFRWLALGSLCAVGSAAASYGAWVLLGEKARRAGKRGEAMEGRSPVEMRSPVDARFTIGGSSPTSPTEIRSPLGPRVLVMGATPTEPRSPIDMRSPVETRGLMEEHN